MYEVIYVKGEVQMKIKKAFTLIELLVVISIIALLMAILMPALGKARKQAMNVVCKTNLHQWMYAVELYTHDNNGSYWEGFNVDERTKSNWWMEALRVYFDDIDELRCCPTAKKPRVYEDGTTNDAAKRPFAAWMITENSSTFGDVANGDYGSYISNGWIENKVKTGSYKDYISKYWRRSAAIRDSSNVPLFTDGQWVDTWPNSDVDTSLTPPTTEDFYWNNAGSQQIGRIVQNRHDEKQNVLTVDGAVNTVGIKKLWTYKWSTDFDTRNRYTSAGGATKSTWPEWMQGFKDY